MAKSVPPDGTDMAGEAVLTLFPGTNSLETSIEGQWHGHEVEARLHPGGWLQHGVEADPGFVQWENSDLRTGVMKDDWLRVARGLRLLTPVAGSHGAIGLGLYHTAGSLSLTPGVDGFWQAGRTRFSMQAGLDSSWRLESRTQGRLTVESFAERAGDNGAVLYGTVLAARLSEDTSVFQRFVTGSDRHGVTQWTLGSVQRVGTGIVSLDVLTAPLAGQTLHQTTAAFNTPLHQNYLSLRWQQSTYGAQRQQQIQMLTLIPVQRGISGWLGETVQWQPDKKPQTFLTLGASLLPVGRWSVHTEWSQTGPSELFQFKHFQMRGTVGFQYNPNLLVKVMCAPSPIAGTSEAFRPIWGLQIAHRFRYQAAPPTGDVQGRVLLDGLPCTQPLAIALDGQEAVSTDKTGHFLLRHVALGTHTVGLVLALLPANINPAEPACSVNVGPQHNSPVLLHIDHVGQVSGQLYVGADEFGSTDLTAAIGVTITDDTGHETTTDANGRFLLGNLPPGPHTIRLVKSTLPPHFCMVSPAQVVTEVICDRPQFVRFQTAPERRLIQFSNIAGTAE